MKLVLWHGYLLSGTGSNIYTQHVARAWGRLGHDVRVLCQEPHPELFELGSNVRVIRPAIGPLLPTFVVDRYEGLEARHVADLTAGELDSYLRLNVAALRSELAGEPAAMVLANHAIMGGPVVHAACGSGTPYAIKLHGSELEYAIRGHPRLAELARPPVRDAAAIYAGSRHIVDVATQLLGPGPFTDRITVVPPGVDVDAFRPDGGSRERLLSLLRADRPRAHPERHPDATAADRLESVGGFVLYFGKLLRQKGVQLLLEAWQRLAAAHPELTLVVVGFGADRDWLEAQAGPRVVFTGAMDHAQLQAMIPLAETVVVPSVLPEAFGMVAAESASCGVMTVVAAHSGLAEVADGLGDAARTFDGGAGGLEAVLRGVLEMDAGQRRRAGLRGRERVVARWSWARIAQDLIDGVLLSRGTSPA
jgi:glycosyltransferase involved in cell wall biosynthesis